MQRTHRRLGDLLVDSGIITNEQLASTLEQKDSSQKLGHALIERGYISEQQLIDALSFQLSIPQVHLASIVIDHQVVNLIDQSFSRENELICYKKSDNILYVAMANPLNFFAIDDLQMMTGFHVKVALALPSEITSAINRLYNEEDSVSEILTTINKNTVDEDELVTVNDTPILKIINKLLLSAVEERASDIHIDPHEFSVVVRFRIDGELHTYRTFPKELLSVLVTRIKVMSQLDITEKRLPQDGRVKVTIGKSRIDLRISVLPTLFGERIVLRLLNTKDLLLKIPNVGFTDTQQKTFMKMVTKPTGLVLITGPTGSGKTSTLYAALNYLNSESQNIITIEDPVEYQIDGINQIQTNAPIGLTFAAGLRAILRQDPNIIMVGEIRDGETAEIAIRASLTGHLVLSTLHTNDVPTTIYRLIDMGVDPFLVAASLTGVVAQRLVRRVCRDCAHPFEPSPIERGLFAKAGFECPPKLMKGVGCKSCHQTGYLGRTAVHEMLELSEEISELLIMHHSFKDIQNLVKDSGGVSMLENGLSKVADGITTVDELLKIIS
ncbi:GspE/PulE family protein [Sporolactobacillus terrae]|uniref:Type II secretion system protein GspE n=1 Tax=Sporolactobacillus terrae TaxID=269673 RepID=A0ABX5Q899_9BACL|nr:ATPase, T2SS/T4P/T4SS family [Sporolactobacillus terrae]QAA22888.1 type II secretion system protein GspE [Sporolactobacillus terrae]QAA25861.1 type II secretion system protein GspE [Sporolactobacillus terrae]UAK17735.1 Flp pilus assembly complex ATPase component TadA [Sporolactobacillus terrae]